MLPQNEKDDLECYLRNEKDVLSQANATPGIKKDDLRQVNATLGMKRII